MPVDPARIFDSLTTGVLAVSTDHRVEYLNPAAESLLGVSARQAC